MFVTVKCATHTRIHAFASHHHEQVVRELLEAGARKDVASSAALSLARRNGHSEICKLLALTPRANKSSS